MNFIDNIEIKNFKSIRHQKIEGCKRVNVFIGYPNVGKSNILEALSLFSINEQDEDFSSFVRIGELTTLFHNADISKRAEIKINKRHRVIATFQNNNVDFKQQFENVDGLFESDDAIEIHNNVRPEIFYKKLFQLGKDKKIINYSDGLIGKENVLGNVKKYEFQKKIEYGGETYFELSYPHGENIFNIISTNPDLKKEIADLFQPYNLELLYITTHQRFDILKRIPEGIFTIPYELVADTIQRLIFYKTAIKSNKNTKLLFEEPEAHMFPPYLAKLTGDIIYDDNNNQYFIATHSPFILNDFIEDMDRKELSVFIVGYNNETTIKKLTDDQVEDVSEFGIELLFNLESYLENGSINHA